MLDATNDAPVSTTAVHDGAASPADIRETSAGAPDAKVPASGHATTPDSRRALPVSGIPTPAAAGQALLPTKIAGLEVHPLANRLPFPLMVGRDFEQLVESIADHGVRMPVTLHEGKLLEGRNRARAVEVLRGRGMDIELPTESWRPNGGETPLEFVLTVNAVRRHMTADQIAALMASQALAEIRAACAARQQASRFKKGAANPDYDAAALSSVPPRGSASADGVGGRPSSPSSADKFQQSAIGRLSTLAGVSRHTAEQAVRLVDDVAAGRVPREDLDGVIDGTIPLRKASRRKAGPRNRPRPPSDTTTKTAAERMFEEDFEPPVEPGDEPVDGPADEPAATEPEVRRRWERFKQPFAIADHGELRRVMARIIAEEQRRFDR